MKNFKLITFNTKTNLELIKGCLYYDLDGGTETCGIDICTNTDNNDDCFVDVCSEDHGGCTIFDSCNLYDGDGGEGTCTFDADNGGGGQGGCTWDACDADFPDWCYSDNYDGCWSDSLCGYDGGYWA